MISSLVLSSGFPVGSSAGTTMGFFTGAHPRLDAARAAPPLLTKAVRAAQPLPKARQEPAILGNRA